jgi:hypothetical protein
VDFLLVPRITSERMRKFHQSSANPETRKKTVRKSSNIGMPNLDYFAFAHKTAAGRRKQGNPKKKLPEERPRQMVVGHDIELWRGLVCVRAPATINSPYEEPFVSCQQGRGSPSPAAAGPLSPIRAVSEQHLQAVLSLARRTVRRLSALLLASLSSGNLGRFNQCLARGVPGSFVVPLEQFVTRMPACAMQMRQALENLMLLPRPGRTSSP